MKIKKILLMTIAMLSMTSANAELYLEAAFETGGDNLVETTTGESISAGSGLKFAIGSQNPVGDNASIRFSAGYLFDSIDATNGEADTSAITLDAMYIVNSGVHSFGIGGTMHMGPEYNEDSDIGSFTVEFDDAFGLVLQYGYHFTSGLEFGVRYTNLTYEIGPFDLDASGVGLYISNGF